MSLVEKIKALCKQHKMSVNALERTLNFGKSAIWKWDNHPPSVDKLQAVADYFHVSTDYLLGRTDDKYEGWDDSWKEYHKRVDAEMEVNRVDAEKKHVKNLEELIKHDRLSPEDRAKAIGYIQGLLDKDK